MRKIVIYTMIGLCGYSAANASIVSRGFLDETLQSYVDQTALNLKANASDLTTLSEIIGEPDENISYCYHLPYSGYVFDYYCNGEWVDKNLPTNNISEFIRLSYSDPEFPGVAGLAERIFQGWEESGIMYLGLVDISHEFRDFFDWSGSRGITYVLKEGVVTANGQTIHSLPYLSSRVDKIGDLPAEYETVGAAIRAINAKIEGKINNLSATASNGKYVLTAVKEGDQTTYAWESIDRSETENKAQ